MFNVLVHENITESFLASPQFGQLKLFLLKIANRQKVLWYMFLKNVVNETITFFISIVHDHVSFEVNNQVSSYIRPWHI